MSSQAIFGAGCFWCVETVFRQKHGVLMVEPGYSGGQVNNPTYNQVCAGETGHADVVRLTFDPKIVSYAELLALFWNLHDPTTLNRQGADIGTQYRSVIFCCDDEQMAEAEASRRDMQESGRYTSSIVTAIEPARDFFPAEEYHRDYYARNRDAPYCKMVIAPKLRRLKKELHL